MRRHRGTDHTEYTDYTYNRDETGHVVEATAHRTVDGTRHLKDSEVMACPITVSHVTSNKLAFTGSDPTGALTLAGVLAIGGLVLLFIRRRKSA